MSKKNNAPRLGNMNTAVSSLLASVVCILIGLAVGFVVLLVISLTHLPKKGD